MELSDFHFDLPEALIAQFPAKERGASRLLCLDNGQITHSQFPDLSRLLQPGDLLVMNNSRVFPARLHGHKQSGGKVEVLVERLQSEQEILAHIKASKAPKPGTIIQFKAGQAEVLERQDSLFQLRFDIGQPLLDWLERHGEIPLPPYIERSPETEDRERYQTVYAKHDGSVAAPTAGLHFDKEFLAKLRQQGIQTAEVTLHVGAGTFQPVRAEKLSEHDMHSEILTVSQAVCDQVNQTRQQGGRVIAIGTTTVRSLETAAQSGEIKPYQGETKLFIYPGYEYKCVDAMITNFHLPKSSLLMLLCAFAGFDEVMGAYREAVKQKYRFFSYGDAMFVTKK